MKNILIWKRKQMPMLKHLLKMFSIDVLPQVIVVTTDLTPLNLLETSEEFCKMMGNQLRNGQYFQKSKNKLNTRQWNPIHFTKLYEILQKTGSSHCLRSEKKFHFDFEFFTFYLIKCVIWQPPARHPGDWPE